jgi:hypothetical protein
VKKFFLNILTEPDNHTFCPVRILSILGVLQYLTTSGFHYVQHAIFDPQAFAVGFGAIIGSVGVALGLKKDTPTDPNAPTT